MSMILSLARAKSINALRKVPQKNNFSGLACAAGTVPWRTSLPASFTHAKQKSNLIAMPKRARQLGTDLESADKQRYLLMAAGHWAGFEIGSGEDFGEEVKRASRNKRLIKYLVERRKKARGKSKSLAEVEHELGLD